MNTHTLVTEFKYLKIKDFEITYEDLRKLKFEEMEIDIPIEFFNMLQEFANYMIDRTKDLELDLGKLTTTWPIADISFDPINNVNVYAEVLSVLKQTIELDLKKIENNLKK